MLGYLVHSKLKQLLDRLERWDVDGFFKRFANGGSSEVTRINRFHLPAWNGPVACIRPEQSLAEQNPWRACGISREEDNPSTSIDSWKSQSGKYLDEESFGRA